MHTKGQKRTQPPRQVIRQQTAMQPMKRQQEARRKAVSRKKGKAVLPLAAALTLFLMIFCAWSWLKEPEVDGRILPGTKQTSGSLPERKVQGISAEAYGRHPSWTEDFLTPNEYSRPGDPLKEVNSIFVHYTANQGTSAAQNRSYFEQLKDTRERSASAHFIIGYEGEIIQCIPLDEIGYAVQTRNEDSISIECCYLEEDGSFTQETYDSLLLLLRWLADTYDLEKEDILRHYDCGGKKCPLYYTENEDAWEKLKEDCFKNL